MNKMIRRNTFDIQAAKQRCLRYRRRILDISQQVSALHIGSAYSCTEIVDCMFHGLLRRNLDGSFALYKVGVQKWHLSLETSRDRQ